MRPASSSSAAAINVHGACPHDCPDTCAFLTTVENGRAVAIAGAKDHPTTAGVLCTKVAHYLERTYSEERLLHPLKRVGPKGRGEFARISWDEALETIVRRFTEIASSTDGPEAIVPYSYAGTMGLVQSSGMDRRFFHRLGASILDRTICSSAGFEGYKATIGATVGTDPEQFSDARLIILWGTNPIVSNLHLWRQIQEAKRRGAKLIAIDPYRSQSAQKCHEHLALLPGTDAALALALMHCLIRDDRIDHDYVARYTLGFDALKARVADWTPERAARITGLATAAIEHLAADYGGNRPTAIRVNYGLQRHGGGGMAMRTIACLPALTGDWRHASGGILLSTSGTYPMNTAALERPDLLPNRPRHINMSAIGNALLEARPPIRALYVYNSNPVAVAPESRKVVRGFSREDLFTVVHDSFLTDTADYADIVLPATTQLEHFDIHKSYGHLYVLVNHPAIAPLGEAKPNSEVFRLLARRLGFTDAALFESDLEIARQAFLWDHPRMRGVDWAKLLERGWERLSLPEPFAPFAQGNFFTPSGRCEFYSETLAAQGIDPLPHFTPPHESRASAPELAARFPLALISPPARNFLNSSFGHLPRFREEEGGPRLELHPEDATARGLADGDELRIFNDRGEFGAQLRITDRVRPGVAMSPSIWWRKLSPDGRNVNEVTSQKLTDFGGTAAFYDVLVEVGPAG
ncbi:MAG: molybdopterin oxidoreductase family protein [Betaproteobacteria bacterium]|nr:molybdopterin oxidoreductase family protein [Betaproteobacteria bacterium]